MHLATRIRFTNVSAILTAPRNANIGLFAAVAIDLDVLHLDDVAYLLAVRLAPAMSASAFAAIVGDQQDGNGQEYCAADESDHKITCAVVF
jgi:hypothetical protein